MLYIYAANVKDGQLTALQNWLREVESRADTFTPNGWKLVGTYFPVFGFGRELFEIHWEVSNYAAFDTAHKEFESNGEYQQFARKLFSFLDTQTQSARLLKRATDRETAVAAA